MKTLIVYSSVTGNTEKVARAIQEIMPEDCVISSVKGAPAPEDFDFIALGFWVTRGGPDKLMQRYMSRVKGKNVGIFATLAAWPDSPHAQKVITRASDLLDNNNAILCSFLCQGKLNPKLRRESEEAQARLSTQQVENGENQNTSHHNHSHHEHCHGKHHHEHCHHEDNGDHHEHCHDKHSPSLAHSRVIITVDGEEIQKDSHSTRGEGHKKRHPMTPERMARLVEAEKHPDEADLQHAKECFAKALKEAKEK